MSGLEKKFATKSKIVNYIINRRIHIKSGNIQRTESEYANSSV